MDINEKLNYHFQNPEEDISFYKEIADVIVKNQNMTLEQIEYASSWMSLTNAEEAKSILNNRLEELKHTKEEGFAKAA